MPLNAACAEIDATRPRRSEERRVGKSVDLGGRRIIKKKKKEGEVTRGNVVTREALVVRIDVVNHRQTRAVVIQHVVGYEATRDVDADRLEVMRLHSSRR